MTFLLQASTEQLVKWQQSNPLFAMSVNISTRDLCDQGLAGYMKDILDEYQVNASTVVLEITES